MTIQEVEKLAGMTRANIRFYEKGGLLTPERNEANNYREYRDSDVQALRKIKYLRMLGISVKDIKRIIEKELELPEAAECRLEELKEEKKNLEEIEWMCRYIRQHNIQYETMNSEVFEEKMGRLTEVFKDVLSMDTEKEYITVCQLNRTMGLILIYGFVLSAVLISFLEIYSETDISHGFSRRGVSFLLRQSWSFNVHQSLEFNLYCSRY